MNAVHKECLPALCYGLHEFRVCIPILHLHNIIVVIWVPNKCKYCVVAHAFETAGQIGVEAVDFVERPRTENLSLKEDEVIKAVNHVIVLQLKDTIDQK